jgi:hypothetical protein
MAPRHIGVTAGQLVTRALPTRTTPSTRDADALCRSRDTVSAAPIPTPIAPQAARQIEKTKATPNAMPTSSLTAVLDAKVLRDTPRLPPTTKPARQLGSAPTTIAATDTPVTSFGARPLDAMRLINFRAAMPPSTAPNSRPSKTAITAGFLKSGISFCSMAECAYVGHSKNKNAFELIRQLSVTGGAARRHRPTRNAARPLESGRQTAIS